MITRIKPFLTTYTLTQLQQSLTLTFQRSYIAATINREAVPARITKGSDVLKLETWLPNNGKPSWTEVLQITHYREPSAMIGRILYTSYCDSYPICLYFKSLPHESIYAIPQEIWHAFIANLPNKKITSALNLEEHRHLWPAYNFVTQTNYQDHYLKAFRNYHFLLSFLPLSTSFMLPPYRWEPDMKTQNLTTQILAGEVDIYDAYHHPRYRYEMESLRCLAKELLYYGIPSGYPVTEIIKSLPKAFIEKWCYEPNWRLMNQTHDAIKAHFAYTYKSCKEKSQKKMEMFIQKLPCAKDNPHEFSKMINTMTSLNGNPGNENVLHEITKGNILFHCKSNFGIFAEKKFNRDFLLDYNRALYLDLIFPETVRQSISMSCQGAYTTIYSSERFQITLTNRTATEKLIDHYNKWHKRVHSIEAKKPTPIFDFKWQALCADQIIDGVSFQCLTNQVELKKEGREMIHCVGGFSSACRSGEYHIFSVSHGNARATLSLSVKKNNGKAFFERSQLYAKENSKPCDTIKLAADEFVRQLNASTIKISEHLGSDKTADAQLQFVREKNISQDHYEKYPYLFSGEKADEIQESIYQCYLSAGVLPRFLVAENYRAAIEKSGIRQLIQEDINRSLEKSQKFSRTRWP